MRIAHFMKARCTMAGLMGSLQAPRLSVVFAIGLLCLVTTCQIEASEEAWSTQHFNDLKDRWDSLVDVPVTIEGRITSLSKNSMRLARCAMPFVLKEEDARQVSSGKSVVVRGTVRKEKNTDKLLFDVSKVSVVAGDGEKYRIRAGEIRAGEAQPWYELADWAENRATFFADTELKVLADSARMRGLQTEARILNPRTPEALESLAKKARELKLDERFAMELQFEGMWLQVTTMIRDGQPDPAALASTVMQISRKFPGAETPLAKWIAVDLQKAEVLNEYAAADDANRKFWHRQLMIAATAAEIQARLLADGRNGVELAEEWRIRLPERANESQSFLDRYDAFRMARLKTMTREELLAFTKDLEARKKADIATQARRAWMEHRAELSIPQGGAGVVRMAENHRTIYNDEQGAIAILQNGWLKFPEDKTLREAFEGLGYRLSGNRWTRELSTANSPATTSAKAPGELAQGMTMEQAKSLLGAPPRRTRLILGSGPIEHWIYGEGANRLILEFKSGPGNSLRLNSFYTDTNR